MKMLIILVLCFISISLPVKGLETDASKIKVFDQVQSQNFSGKFKQIRQLKLIKKPLVSTGQFEVLNNGFTWHTKAPFEVKYFIDQEVIKETVDGVVKVQKLADNPQMQVFSQVFSSLIKLDKTVLLNNFSIEEFYTEQGWRLNLTPITTPIDKVFALIEINGNRHINQIKTISHGGDLNTINLSYER